jgi:predicted RNA-binding Zn-ribbon protein involved in translation (DUF1610 family)
MLRRVHSSRSPLHLLMLILATTPFAYHRPFPPGRPGRKSSSWDEGWAQYCATCAHIDVTNTSEITDGDPCSRNHTSTEVLFSYVCPQCHKELLFREKTAPRRAADIQCDKGIHTPKEILAREQGTGSDMTLPET